MFERSKKRLAHGIKQRQEYIILFCCLSIFLLLYFGQLFDPHAAGRLTLDFDFYHYHLPYNWYVQTLLGKGWLPLWDPLSENGYPLIGESTLQFFYLPNLIRIFVFPPSTLFRTILSLEVMHLFHLYVLGFGMFVLLRKRYRYTFFTSLFASTAITFNGIVLFLTGHGHITTVELFTWFPWLLYTLGQVIETGQKKYAIGAIIVIYFTLNAGYLPLAAISFLLTFIYLSFTYFFPFRREMLPNIFTICLLFVLGIGLSGIMLGPQLELALHSGRVHENSTLAGYQDVQIYSNTPVDILKDFLYPVAMSNGYFAYVGLIITILLVSFFFIGRSSRFEKGSAVLAFFLILSTLGGYLGPLFLPLYYWPTLGLLRVPSRLMFFADFFIVILAASALNTFQSSDEVTRKVKLLFERFLPILVGLLLIVIIFLLFLSSSSLITLTSTSEQIFEQTIFLFLLLILSVGIIWQFIKTNGKGNVNKFFLLVVLFLDLTMASNKIVPLASLRDAQKSGLPDLSLKYMTQLPFAQGARGVSYYKDWFNDEEIYGLKPSIKGSTPSHLYAAETLDTYDTNPDIQLIRGQKEFVIDNHTYNRWWIVTDCIFVTNNEEALSLLTAKKIDPHIQIVLLNKDKTNVVNNCRNNNIHYSLHLDDYQNNLLKFSYSSSADGIFYLSEMYYPGWQASVDGNRVPILRGNYSFRAIPIPKGDHTVSLSYRPISVIIGLILSSISLIVIISGVIFYSRKNRRKR